MFYNLLCETISQAFLHDFKSLPPSLLAMSDYVLKWFWNATSKRKFEDKLQDQTQAPVGGRIGYIKLFM
jgi:hypothetical protein